MGLHRNARLGLAGRRALVPQVRVSQSILSLFRQNATCGSYERRAGLGVRLEALETVKGAITRVVRLRLLGSTRGRARRVCRGAGFRVPSVQAFHPKALILGDE